MKVTGEMVNYYFVCKRRLWLFQHNINMETLSQNQSVQIGKTLDESSYKDKNIHHIEIDNTINIDMIQNWQTIHEVKKSKSVEEAAIWQLKYYIYYLRKKGINVSKGVIDYPLLRKCVKVDYTSDDEKQMEKYIDEIEQICLKPAPPKPKLTTICKGCAFYEYCFS